MSSIIRSRNGDIVVSSSLMYRRAVSCPPDQKDTPARQLSRSSDLTPLGEAVPSNVSEWTNALSIHQQNTHDRRRTSGTLPYHARRWRADHSQADRRSRIRSQNDTIAALTETPAGVWRLAGCAAGQSTTAPRRRPCGRLSNSIFPSFWRSNHRVVSAVIEQWDGLTGIGHDDAWKGGRHQPVAV